MYDIYSRKVKKGRIKLCFFQMWWVALIIQIRWDTKYLRRITNDMSAACVPNQRTKRHVSSASNVGLSRVLRFEVTDWPGGPAPTGNGYKYQTLVAEDIFTKERWVRCSAYFSGRRS